MINVLYDVCIISKDEYEELERLRIIRNKLDHNPYEKYKIKNKELDALLGNIVQVLLRIRELPPYLTKNLNTKQADQFFEDLGYDEFH